jgi:dUTP pyrophosphatase
MNLTAKIKLDDGATMPTRAHASDVGYDVRALTVSVAWRRDHDKNIIWKVRIDTGVHVTPPDGYYFELVPNSRIVKGPFSYGNSIGVIDPEYTGSIKVILNCEYGVTHDAFIPQEGDVVGQLILRKKYDVAFTQVDALDETERGEGGFGSTEKEKGTCTYWCPGSMLGSKPECLKTGASECIASTCPHYQKWDKDQIFPKSGK